MFLDTRLSRYLTELLCNLKRKIFTVQSAFSLVLLSLFTGFIFGNLFGTFLDTLRLYFFWNGFVALILLLFIEAVNSLVYGISFSKRCDPFRESPLKDSFYSNQKKKGFLSLFYEFPVYAKVNDPQNATISSSKTKKKAFLYDSIIHMERTLNSFKIGLLFGFFVDSFKVGS